MTTFIEIERNRTDLYGDPAAVWERTLRAVAADGFAPAASDPVPEVCRGALYYRDLPDGRCVALYPLVMGTVRIVVGPTGASVFDDAWCYATPDAGILAASAWDGNGDPPEGWFRHIGSGRRRPEGDPAKEYVAR